MIDWTCVFQSFQARRPWVLAVLLASLPACAADDNEDTGDDVEDDDSITEERDSGRKDSGSARDATTDARARDAEITRDAGRVDSGSSARDSGASARDSGRGTSGESGTPDASETSASDPEPGRLAGITAAHNRVRAEVDTNPPLPALTWSPEIAQVAQAYADKLATSCSGLVHSMDRRYGENLAMFSVRGAAEQSTPNQAVDGWASEAACWSYGTIGGSEVCDMTCAMVMSSSPGCGHYTQVVWRKSQQVGCGVAQCAAAGGFTSAYWVCNYSPQGNFVGQAPY